MRKLFFIVLTAVLVCTGCTKRIKIQDMDKFTVMRDGKSIKYQQFIKELSHYDVVFIGEKHDDSIAHYVEIRLTMDLYRTNGSNLTIAMEMFERDVQEILDDYLKKRINETEFLSNSRPWNNYKTGYRAIIEFAKEKNLNVIAANVPRRIANTVAMRGIGSIDSLRKNNNFVAEMIDTLQPEYYKIFASTMKMIGKMGKMKAMNVNNFFYAQCIKDNTMAESIYNYRKNHKQSLILMMNGNFHSDFGLGIPYRLKILDNNVDIAIVHVMAKGEEIEKGQCDYLIIRNE
ncbi:ChaN family lipoprotein [candidate division WOR-3 bacterium]|nr:ChaN family lipoprotein [candidate division WOR-3 bacterium]